MTINKAAFFASVRASLFKGSLKASQVEGLEAILDYYSKKYSCVESLAYILATAFHETAGTIRPITEYGKGKNYDYGKKLKMSRKPYTTPDQLYYGRGLIQTTWYENYQAVGKKLGVDLLNNPDLLLTLPYSVPSLVEGMVHGWYTGKRLADYFLGEKQDPLNARRIVNGMDKAALIASYYQKFLAGLRAV